MKSGAVAGLVIGIILIVAVIIGLSIYFLKRKDHTDNYSDSFETPFTSGRCSTECGGDANVTSCIPTSYPVCAKRWQREDAFECVEGQWVVLQVMNGKESILGYYDILRSNTFSPTNLAYDDYNTFDVQCAAGRDCSTDEYMLTDASIHLTDGTVNGDGVMNFTIIANGDVINKITSNITIPDYYKEGSIPQNCKPIVWTTPQWDTEIDNVSFIFYTISDTHYLRLTKSANFGARCYCTSDYTYVDTDCGKFNNAVCTECTPCSTGTYFTDCSKEDDSVCDPCPENFYMPDDSHYNTSCIDCISYCAPNAVSVCKDATLTCELNQFYQCIAGYYTFYNSSHEAVSNFYHLFAYHDSDYENYCIWKLVKDAGDDDAINVYDDPDSRTSILQIPCDGSSGNGFFLSGNINDNEDVTPLRYFPFMIINVDDVCITDTAPLCADCTITNQAKIILKKADDPYNNFYFLREFWSNLLEVPFNLYSPSGEYNSGPYKFEVYGKMNLLSIKYQRTYADVPPNMYYTFTSQVDAGSESTELISPSSAALLVKKLTVYQNNAKLSPAIENVVFTVTDFDTVKTTQQVVVAIPESSPQIAGYYFKQIVY
jgi:hypothetical protein